MATRIPAGSRTEDAECLERTAAEMEDVSDPSRKGPGRRSDAPEDTGGGRMGLMTVEVSVEATRWVRPRRAGEESSPPGLESLSP